MGLFSSIGKAFKKVGKGVAGVVGGSVGGLVGTVIGGPIGGLATKAVGGLVNKIAGGGTSGSTTNKTTGGLTSVMPPYTGNGPSQPYVFGQDNNKGSFAKLALVGVGLWGFMKGNR
jgi:hypothetical protein